MCRLSKWKFYGEDKGDLRKENQGHHLWLVIIKLIYTNKIKGGGHQIIEMIHILWGKSPHKNNFWMTHKDRTYGRKLSEIRNSKRKN